MLRRLLAYTVVLGVWAGPTAWAGGEAWSSPYLAASEPDVKKLLEDRTKFVQENYQLPAAESSKVLQSLNGLVSVHERYQRETSLTLDRLRLVITLVGTDTGLAEVQRNEKVARFQGQYRRILSRAPLSLQNVVKLVEAALSTEQITPARDRIQAKFANAVKISNIPFAIENLDALAAGPIDPGQRPEIRLPEPEAKPSEQATPPQITPPSQNPQAQTPVRQPPIAPQPRPVGPMPPPNAITPQPVPSAPVPPAPPTAQWPELVKGSADKYDFSADQRASAENVLMQSQARADEHRKRNQAAYDEAAKLSDEDAKMKKLQELNKPVDAVFDQMQKRINSIASMEQQNKAAQKEKSPKN